MFASNYSYYSMNYSSIRSVPRCTSIVNDGDVLLRREIALKVIREKVKFSNCDFYNNFRENE